MKGAYSLLTWAFLSVCLSSCVLNNEIHHPLKNLKEGVWIKVHEQKKTDLVHFIRQAHGGSCFDSKRGRLVLFGSNTHSLDWKNSPFYFDTKNLSWEQMYPEDKLSTYHVDDKGHPVAGVNGEHPWAMHTFGSVIYDNLRDQMVVMSYPGHLVSGKRGKSVAHLWPKIKKHPTWVLDFKNNRWSALPTEAEHFFINSGAYDSHRSVVYGYNSSGVYELSSKPRSWSRVGKGGLIPGWGHNNCVYDSEEKALVVFGGCKNSNLIGVYSQQTQKSRVMPTPGLRPPPDQHNPMAYHPIIKKTVVLVDRTIKKDQAKSNTTETWCYDLKEDKWEYIQSANLPFSCGMNFNLEYDKVHNILWLVTGVYPKPTSVWALRL